MKTRQYLWALIRYRPGLYAVDALCWTVIHTTPLLPGLVVRAFFDTLSGAAPAGSNPWGYVALFAAIGLARVVLEFCGAFADIRHRFLMSALLRRNLLARVLDRPGAQALPEAPGSALSRFRDDAEHAEDAISWTLDLIGNALFAAGACLILLSINATITALVFLPLIGVIAAARAASTRLQHYRQAGSQATAEVTGALGELFGAVQAIQVAGAEAPVLAHLAGLNAARRRWMLRDRLLSQVLDSTYANTVSLGTGLILLLASGAMQAGQFTVGDFALFVYYLGFVSDFTQFFGMFLAHYRQTAVAFARMTVLLQGAPARTLVAPHPLPLRGPLPVPGAPPPAPAKPARLDVRGLTYVYPESGRGIRDVALTVGAGELVVITGRIGAGKTTLLRALLGLLPAQAGTIHWNGAPVADPAAFFQPPHSAYTPQVPQLFSATLEENVRLGLAVAPARLAAALDAAVLGADLAALPAGLATPVGARGVRLSGGQVQRVAAARMLVRAPALLVFDDLSSALDVATERLLWDRLLALPDRPACLVVSHRPAVLRRADRLILLDEGQVVAAGPPAAVLAAYPALLHGDSAANGAA